MRYVVGNFVVIGADQLGIYAQWDAKRPDSLVSSKVCQNKSAKETDQAA
jgi:hypothetical protein